MSSPRDFIDDSDDYWRRDERTIKIHGPEGFAGMRLAGRLAAETLDFITPYVQPGVSTGELDKLCHDYILDHKAIPAPLGYRGYPKSICTSINHVVCHGIPSDKRLQDGDIVNIDVTTILDGWYGDTSRMFFAGDVGVKARRLCDITYEAMMRGIAAAKPGGQGRRHRRTPSRPMSRRSASPSCATSRAMGSAASSTTRPTSCITARPAPGRC